jgi:hypothetical protein
VTIKTYATPEAFRQAIEIRLKKEAAAAGRDLNRFRQLLVFDRFLAMEPGLLVLVALTIST